MDTSLGTDAAPMIIGNINDGIGSNEKEQENIRC
jgi:hypothetical protein